MRRKKTLIPNDFRDFLSIISFIGFIAIFFEFALNFTWIAENMNGLFLITAGVGLMVVGKVFSIRKWVKDGIQNNEIIQILSGTIGLSSLVIGIMLLSGVELNVRFLGFVGIVAIFPAIFILVDYIAKNN